MAKEPRLLVDNIGTFLVNGLEEDAARPGRMIARGEFALCDEATSNGRVYGRQLWEREIGRLAPKLSERKIFGELDHPSDGKTKLNRVSHILTNLRIEKGKVVGEAEIVDTGPGKDLQAILRAGGRPGVSSRGFGTTIPDGSGREIVSEDYRLMTFDFVADPADETAVPNVRVEEKHFEETDMELTLQILKDKHPDLVKQIQAETVPSATTVEEKVSARVATLRDEFRKDLLTQIAEMKESAVEEARSELLSDPDVGRSKVALDRIKDLLRPFLISEDAEKTVSEKDTEIAALKRTVADLSDANAKIKTEMQELETVSRRVGHQLYLERKIAGGEHADEIRLRLKDIEFKDLDAISERVEEMRKAIQAEATESKEKQEALVQKDKKIADLQEQLERALAVGHEFGLQAYAERRIAGNPMAPKIRKIIEAQEFADETEVDAFIDAYLKDHKPSEDYAHVRSRLSKANVHPKSGVIVEGDDDTTPKSAGAVLGVPIDELAALCGTRDE